MANVPIDKIKEISNLTPQERLEELKKLKEQQKKDLDEINLLLKKSVSEIEDKEIEMIEEIEENIEENIGKLVRSVPVIKQAKTYESPVDQLRETQGQIYALGNRDIYSMLDNLRQRSEQGDQWSDTDQESFDVIKNSLLYTSLDYTGNAPEEVLDNIIASRKVLIQLGYKADWWKS